jgi:hypothetical protein
MNRKETKLLVENWRKVLSEGLYENDSDVLQEGIKEKIKNAAIITTVMLAPLVGNAKGKGFEGQNSTTTESSFETQSSTLNTLQASLKKYSNFSENAKKFNKDNTKLNISTFNNHFDNDEEDITIEEENMKKIAFAVAAFLNPEIVEKNIFLIPTFSSIVTSTSINNLPDGGGVNSSSTEEFGLNKLGEDMLGAYAILKNGNSPKNKKFANAINYLNNLASKDSSLLNKIMNLKMLEKSKNSKSSMTEFSKYLDNIGADVEDYHKWSTSGSEEDFKDWFENQN